MIDESLLFSYNYIIGSIVKLKVIFILIKFTISYKIDVLFSADSC